MPRPAVALVTKAYAAQRVILAVLLVLSMAQKKQQLATSVPLFFTRNGSSAGDTPTPRYARSPVPLHSGADDGDIVTVTDAENVRDAETDAETDGDTDNEAMRLGEMEELGVTDIENDGGALGAIKTDVLVSR